MKKIISLVLITFAFQSFAQKDTTQKLTISGYIEAYYTYDLSQPANHTRPPFVYSYNRHNEVNLNLGYIKAGYTASRVRANLALMAGTYSNANLAAEPGVLKNIYEANVGVKLSKKHNLWVDAGIFASHIGFESAVGKDCWNLTRSILADNSPYYESGAKLTYINKNEKWLISGLVLNGWQHIQRPDGNNAPAFGHQLQYKPISTITLNSSSFIGSDTPDSVRMMRYFHNFYAQLQLHKKFGLIAGFDIGWQQKNKGSSVYNNWYSPVLIARFSPASRWNIALRGEYYSDRNSVIIATGTPHGFQTFGYSVNVDYYILENVLWRIEARTFQSSDNLYVLNNQPSNENYFFNTSLSVSF